MADGYVERGPRNQKLHRSIQPYSEPKPGAAIPAPPEEDEDF